MFAKAANIDAQLVCLEKDKAKHLRNHQKFKKGSRAAMIDLEGCYHDIHKHDPIKGRAVAPARVALTKRSAEEAGMTSADFVVSI